MYSGIIQSFTNYSAGYWHHSAPMKRRLDEIPPITLRRNSFYFGPISFFSKKRSSSCTVIQWMAATLIWMSLPYLFKMAVWIRNQVKCVRKEFPNETHFWRGAGRRAGSGDCWHWRTFHWKNAPNGVIAATATTFVEKCWLYAPCHAENQVTDRPIMSLRSKWCVAKGK